MTDRTKDHITEGLEELQTRGITSWPAAAVAVLFRFGTHFAAYIALVVVLGFFSWLVWGWQLAQAKEIAQVRKEQVEDLRSASSEKGVLVKSTTEALNATAEANEKLSKSLDDLSRELRQTRHYPSQ